MLVSPIFRQLSKVSTFVINQSPEIQLASSIALEVASTSLLKETLTNKLFYLPVYSGYLISFTILPYTLRKYSLSYVYPLWSGIGIIATMLVDTYIYSEVISRSKIFGTILILCGIKIIK